MSSPNNDHHEVDFLDCSQGTGAGSRATECSICSDEIESIQPSITHTANNCLSTYHTPCLSRWVHTQGNVGTCPMCRGVVANLPWNYRRPRTPELDIPLDTPPEGIRHLQPIALQRPPTHDYHVVEHLSQDMITEGFLQGILISYVSESEFDQLPLTVRERDRASVSIARRRGGRVFESARTLRHLSHSGWISATYLTYETVLQYFSAREMGQLLGALIDRGWRLNPRFPTAHLDQSRPNTRLDSPSSGSQAATLQRIIHTAVRQGVEHISREAFQLLFPQFLSRRSQMELEWYRPQSSSPVEHGFQAWRVEGYRSFDLLTVMSTRSLMDLLELMGWLEGGWTWVRNAHGRQELRTERN